MRIKIGAVHYYLMKNPVFLLWTNEIATIFIAVFKQNCRYKLRQLDNILDNFASSVGRIGFGQFS